MEEKGSTAARVASTTKSQENSKSDLKEDKSEEDKNEAVTEKKKLGRGKAFRKFIHNSETGEYLGRTCLSWSKIGVYYLIFYGFLLTFFCMLMIVSLHFLSNTEPYYKQGDSVIGASPGLEYFPTPFGDGKDSDLLWFLVNGNDEGNSQYYTEQIDNLLSAYTDQEDNGAVDCTGGGKDEKQACLFDTKQLDSCATAPYGFDDGKPCIFLKINRVYDWVPKVYSSAPDGASESLQAAISGSSEELVFVDCKGTYPEDKANLKSITYTPQQGFSANFFPFKNQEGYMNPIVAVKFEPVMRDMMISVECHLWAQNIKKQDEKARIGGAKFSLMIESNP